MDVQPGEQVLFSGHPSWRSILRIYVIGVIIAGAAIGIGVAVDKTGIGVAAGVAIFVITVIVGFLMRVGTTYNITTERLVIQRGILSRSRQETTLDRVQNVNTNQSLFERILQVGTVDFDTAGTEQADFAFRGVADPNEIVSTIHQVQRQRQPAAG